MSNSVQFEVFMSSLEELCEQCGVRLFVASHGSVSVIDDTLNPERPRLNFADFDDET